MKISIISGSHRQPSQSEKIGRYIESVFQKDEDITPYLFTLANNPLPLWDQTLWEGSEEWRVLLAPIKENMATSDAFVIITPEWHGQVPSGLKNFFLLMSKLEVGHKPALIVAVSAGAGGAYPVAELRMSSYKNNRICYIPEQMIIRDVEKVFNENPEDNDERSDKYYKKRLNWTLQMLVEYGEALKTMRDKSSLNLDDFASGL